MQHHPTLPQPVNRALERGPVGRPKNRMARLGKARTGRLPDGVLHDVYPASAAR